MHVFVMLEFSEIRIEDKEWVDRLLAYSDFRATEYCFSTLYMWAVVYHSQIARWKDFLVVRSDDGKLMTYLYPAGRGDVFDLKTLLALMEEDAARNSRDFALAAITEATLPLLKEASGDRYDITPARDSFDYVYEAEKMISLSGKKYQSKRNFIARFKELPDWSYESITAENLPECVSMNDEWCALNGCGANVSMQKEACAVKRALAAFVSLGLKGAMLRVGGKVVAYTVGEKMNSDTFIVHIEKAFSDVKGAYPMMNREFLAHEAAGCLYVNREDDAGDEGLRKAKLSYNPVFMIEKYVAVIKK